MARLDVGCCREHGFCAFLATPENWTSTFFARPRIFLSLRTSEINTLSREGGQRVRSRHHITEALVQESGQKYCNPRSVPGSSDFMLIA